MLSLLLVGCNPSNEKDTLDEVVLDEEDTGSLEVATSCATWVETGERGFLALNDSIDFTLPPCTSMVYSSAGSKLSTLLVSLVGNQEVDESLLEYRIENLLGETIVDWHFVHDLRPMEVSLDHSGEFMIYVRSHSTEKNVTAQLSVDCQTGCDAEFTRYPIVFMHGLAGFDTLLSVFDYWVGVEDLLLPQGYAANIYGVSAFDSTAVRAEQWREHLDALYRETGARRVNLIAHSQGGLDARYYAALLDLNGRVASITTIATPHMGTAVAGLLTGVVELGPTDGQIVDALVSGAAELFGTTGDSFSEQLAQMTPENMAIFNSDIPDVPGVQYFSWAGKSCRYLQWSCQSEMDGETVSSYFLLSHAYLESQEGDNDGLVSVSSAEWGTFLGVLPADHIDEVGHRFDLSSQPFDAAGFYLSEARRLAGLGL